MPQADGMNYAPRGKARPVVGPGEFVIAATALEHGHIFGQCNGLVEAGATLKWVWDSDPAKVAAFEKQFPQVRVGRSLEEILSDKQVRLVAAADVPSRRCELGLEVMRAGKDYFTDKAPLTTLDQLAAARAVVGETARKYMVYYSERLHVECAVLAGQLIHEGAIGRVVQTIGTGPHRLAAASRPAWYWSRETYGGILCDIGSHQIEQFLHYTGNADATVAHSKVANYANSDHPEFEDFGDCTLIGANGATGYFRVDWLTPGGLRTWGDGRTIILGTEGYIELRKYIDVARDSGPERLFLVNGVSEREIDAAGTVGFPFFGELILDCLNRTEHAMTQAHAFKAAELCIRAQLLAEHLPGDTLA